MAKSNRKAKRPQARHKKSKASRHDKRSRLDKPNPQRRKTTQAKFPLVGALAALVAPLSAALDARIAFRLGIIISGMILADDRRTASAWFAAAGVFDDWDRFYDCLISIGRNSGKLSTEVLKLVATKFNPGPNGRFVVAVDDSPTKRYGSHVEGAGVHHHPTPGPADGEWLYGHNWVTIARSWWRIGRGAPLPWRCVRCCMFAKWMSRSWPRNMAGSFAPNICWRSSWCCGLKA